MSRHETSAYFHSGAGLSFVFEYLAPTILSALERYCPTERRIFEIGCGDGAFAAELARKGYEVSGIDGSESGIQHANATWPNLNLKKASVDDDLRAAFGTFPIVLSAEVIEHIYLPRTLLRRVWDLLEPNGIAIITTPYHGYFKNLLLSLLNRWDWHFHVNDDYGHIKFFSPTTLMAMAKECGLEPLELIRVGRIPVLAKSMILVARRTR
jgi:2-polyprenyl-3-methyl-5-hydroxy-6-metoxy-1,4-benzoquinol methylase